jgi:glycosyltransferase involved in cell wall biosynthesis
MKRISVITINYNNAAGLEKTIESVVAQDFSDFEFVIIDGGSSDNSTDVIKKFSPEINFWLSEKDSGIFNAQNKGAANATGDYLLFLNSGDELADKNVLSSMAPHLADHDLVSGDLVERDGDKTAVAEMPDNPGVYYFMISTLGHPCTFISRSFFQKMGGYNESLKITGDFEFFLRAVLRENARYRHISLPVSVFYAGGVSSDPAHSEKHRAERRRCWELNFTEPVIRAFEEYTALLRSTELRVGKLIKKVFKPFKS